MTIQIPTRPIGPERPKPGGCTHPGCHAENTVWLSPEDGRRCAAHPPHDPLADDPNGDAA